MEAIVVATENLDDEIDHYLRQGFRLEMLMPADSPREASLTNGSQKINLKSNDDRSRTGEWVIGRAGMMYRDLIPDRLDGKLIASQIRIVEGGPVPDYVHYHKVRFQMIYCLSGRIRVVYEGQGEPFWLEPGDCVLQPPEIRHRVLEAESNSEVLEISSPAEHETWIDHEMKLPNIDTEINRKFSGQSFLRHEARRLDPVRSSADGLLIRDTGILKASRGLADVWNLRVTTEDGLRREIGGLYAGSATFYFVVEGSVRLSLKEKEQGQFETGESFVIPPKTLYCLTCSKDTDLVKFAPAGNLL